ncbi:MAG TPA: MBL fold metallo-hydrolase [Chthoniobacterales bacterium]|nr:MBL fold metallo-hydrolase [Chthoniobacterales bacterium]
MKTRVVCAIAALGLSACSSYHPLGDDDLRKQIGEARPSGPAVQITYFGNTTLLIQDGHTSLLVDGFFSRPGFLRSFLGKIAPNETVLNRELDRAGINSVDAILVGHSHHDHALDATELADRFEKKVVGSESFAQIYRGSHRAERNSTLVTVPREGGSFPFGEFKVTFVPSVHVRSFSFVQRMIEGSITAPLQMPARFSNFKCGDVFALHISHPEGKIVLTTTAGAKPGALHAPEHEANVAFLSTGFLSKETPEARESYWKETVEATEAKVVVPVHWDNFTRKLSKGLKPPPPVIDRTQPSMDFIKGKAGNRPVRVLDAGESIWISGGQVYCPRPGT